MSKARITFDVVCARVLDGACAVDTVADVPPWPPGGENVGSSVSVYMHREVPGAVLLHGVLDGEFVMVGAYSDALRRFIGEFRWQEFEFRSHRGPEGSVNFLHDAFVKLANSKRWRDEDVSAFRWICGAEGAELLRELNKEALRVRAEAIISRGSLH